MTPDDDRSVSSAQDLDASEADAITTARLIAMDEVGAIVACQLSTPLTALLLYLHELKRRAGADASPRAVDEMIENALRETERACEIMDRLGGGLDKIAGAPAQGFKTLTAREREVLQLITAGASNKEGGYRLGISMRTFEVHRAHIMTKLGARNAADLVRIALRGVTR